jgi:uncharacterized membrane protein
MNRLASRYEFLDALRGLAIVLMVQVHCYGWFLAEPARDTPLFATSLVLGWFSGPMFVFIAGCWAGAVIWTRYRARTKADMSKTPTRIDP